MNSEYVLYFISLLILFFIIILSWNLSFSVPVDVEKSIDYLWLNNRNGMFTYYLLFTLLSVVLFTMFWYPEIKFHVPFSQAGIFLLGVAILLLSSFFIDENFSGRRIDTHPLLFQTAVLFIVISVVVGIVTNVKLFL